MLPVDTDSSPDQGVTSGSQSVQEAGRALREACAELRPQAARRAAVGQSLPRPELERLFVGASHFIHDLQPKGLLHGRVLHPPRLDAEVLDWNEADARAADGLVQLQRDGRLFGLLASSGAAADQALARLSASLRWSAADAAQTDSADDFAHRPAATRVVAEHGSAGPAAQTLSARYGKPWIAHASLAPSCALARWADGRLWVWSHSQGIFNLRRDLALAFGIEADAVRVTHVPGAGCYGHNGADDVAFDAAWLARGVPGRTVRVVWTRADELSHSPFGPAMRMELQAGLDAQGRIVDWQHDVWSPGHSPAARGATPVRRCWAPGRWPSRTRCRLRSTCRWRAAAAPNAMRCRANDFASLRVRCHSVVTARRSSALRSLGAFGNVFAAESFIDEIAHATATDPLDLRRRHLQHDARGLAVLEAAATQAGWSTRALHDGCGRGIGYARYKGTGAWCAVVAEVHAAEVLRVLRLTICGRRRPGGQPRRRDRADRRRRDPGRQLDAERNRHRRRMPAGATTRSCASAKCLPSTWCCCLRMPLRWAPARRRSVPRPQPLPTRCTTRWACACASLPLTPRNIIAAMDASA